MKFTIFFGISFFLLLLCSLRLLQIANIGQEKLQANEQGLLPRPPASSLYIPNRQSSVQERSGDVELSAPGTFMVFLTFVGQQYSDGCALLSNTYLKLTPQHTIRILVKGSGHI